MIVLDTVAHETIWGGKRLLPYAHGIHNNIGHLYSLCCEKGLENKILNGSFTGHVFQDYFLSVKNKYGLSQYDKFPLILALVEASLDLSIQVHPDDEVAMAEENAPYGKNESWYFLSAPETGALYNGCLIEDKVDFRRRAEIGDVMSVVDRLPVSCGDYVYVEAGTLHAITSGSFIYEIEENSPWTYRVYDYHRKDLNGMERELHLDKACRALKPEVKSKKIRLGEEEIEERRYVLKIIKAQTQYTNTSNTLECLTMIEGGGKADGIDYTTGNTIVLEPGEKVYADIRHAVIARPK